AKTTTRDLSVTRSDRMDPPMGSSPLQNLSHRAPHETTARTGPNRTLDGRGAGGRVAPGGLTVRRLSLRPPLPRSSGMVSRAGKGCQDLQKALKAPGTELREGVRVRPLSPLSRQPPSVEKPDRSPARDGPGSRRHVSGTIDPHGRPCVCLSKRGSVHER